jgi:tRNA(Ile)-lysidine synthase
VEEAARKARYRFLFDCARKVQAQAVAVGHTADDQVETVLMHLLRGAGLAGLRGMSFRTVLPEWDPEIPLVRPLLETWRSETLAYCLERGLNPVDDPSNSDTTFYRNRLRHELLPTLETYNPRVKAALFRMSQTLAGDYEVLEAEAGRAMAEIVTGQAEDYLGLDFQKLQGYPAGMQRILFRRAIEALRPGLRDIDYADIERALGFLEQTPRTGQADLASGLRMFIEDGSLYLASREAALPSQMSPQIDPDCMYRLDAPGSLELPGGWVFLVEPVKMDVASQDLELLSSDPNQAWLDASKLHFPVEIRGRHPGDRFIPFGMHGHSVKLADFFINMKLPRRLRDRWPLVCSQGSIAWIPGFRPAQPYTLDPTTREAFHLSLRRDAAASPGLKGSEAN